MTRQAAMAVERPRTLIIESDLRLRILLKAVFKKCLNIQWSIFLIYK